MAPEDPQIVATTSKFSEASVIKSLLESYGIPCHYSTELPYRIYPVSVGGLQIRVFVPAALADEALRVLSDHRRRHYSHLRLVEADEL